ncbi:MAG: hypothetical protein JRN52_13305 [Nitrososphaerota archaeon]|nr:hypothetical protein [Nitrososphaerota archaeon]
MKTSIIRDAVVAIKNRAAVLKLYGTLTASDAEGFITDAEQIMKELEANP